MAKSVAFYYDVGSPATYLAWTQLPAICAEAVATLEFRPILLGGVFQATGNASPAAIPAKGRYMALDLQRFAGRYGVPFAFNRFFPINTLSLMRAATGIQMTEPERLAPFLTAVFKAIWVESRDLNDPAVTAKTLAAAGFQPGAILGLINDPAVKAALKTKTDAAVQRGVFGAPTMFVDDVMYFGQDRLDFVRAALR